MNEPTQDRPSLTTDPKGRQLTAARRVELGATGLPDGNGEAARGQSKEIGSGILRVLLRALSAWSV
jgi:hypothetical protein